MDYIKEVELKYKKREAIGIEGREVKNPRVVCELLKDLQSSVVEKMYALHLNNRNKINCLQVVTIGGLNSAHPEVAEIVRVSLLTASCGLIIAHNHPCGDPDPSSEDRGYTDKVKDVCKLLNIKLLDHIILGDEKYYSFSETGNL